MENESQPPARDSVRIETLLKLGEASWNSWDRRRSYEWKVSFGLWSALGLIAGAQLRGDLHPSKAAR